MSKNLLFILSLYINQNKKNSKITSRLQEKYVYVIDK